MVNIDASIVWVGSIFEAYLDAGMQKELEQDFPVDPRQGLRARVARLAYLAFYYQRNGRFDEAIRTRQDMIALTPFGRDHHNMMIRELTAKRDKGSYSWE